MTQGCTLRVYFRAPYGHGVELGVVEDNSDRAVTQWLLTPRIKSRGAYFLALMDDGNQCIDAKYISNRVALRILDTLP